MTTTTRLAATAVSALTLAALGSSNVLLAGGPASAEGQARVLAFVAHDDQITVDDLGEPSPQGPGLGDVVALTQKLTRDGTRAGSIHNAAVVVDAKHHLSQSSGTIALGDGTIEFGGLVSQTSHFVLAVTGGTGSYQGAAGRVTLDFASGAQRVTVFLTR